MTILEQNVEKLIESIRQNVHDLNVPRTELVDSLSGSLIAIIEQFENAEANGFPIRADLRKLLLKAAVEKAL